MGSIIGYIAALVFVIGLIIFGAWIWRNVMDNGSTGTGLFNRPEKRIGFIESASIDGKRKLVLVRRDNMEHLIMTGGPVDVVIETGIISHQPQAGPATDPGHQNRLLFGARGAPQRSEPDLND